MSVRIRSFVAASVTSAVLLLSCGTVLADYYDNFNDGWYERDPNDPRYDANDPNTGDARLLRYSDGTEIVLVATPGEGGFKKWLIFDPNYPGDSNFATKDTNTVIYLTMDADYEVEAKFKCGSSASLMLPMMLGLLGLSVSARRNR